MEIRDIKWSRIKNKIGRWQRCETHAGQVTYELIEDADNKCGFIIFDINIDGWDLKRKDVDDITNKLGLPSVPVVFEGTLDEAKEFVAKHQMSTLNGGLHEMEGIVLVPRDVQLYDNKHKMIKCKCKYRDMLKAGLAE